MSQMPSPISQQKFSTTVFLYAYIVLSYASAVAASHFQMPVGFGYEQIISTGEVLGWWWLPASQIVAIFAGDRLSYACRNRRFHMKPPRVRYYPELGFLVVLGLLLATLYAGFWEERALNSTGEISRTLAGSSSQVALVVSAIVAIINIERQRLGKATLFLSLAIGLCFAVVDGSRASVLPSIVALLYGIAQRTRWLSATAIISLLLTLTMMSAGRLAARDYAWNIDNVFTYLSGDLNLQYFFAFSYFHLIYTQIYAQVPIQATDVVYSLLPIPSALLPESASVDIRVDAFRPYGAQATLLSFFLPAYLAFHAICGYLAQRVQYLAISTTRAGISVLLVLCFAASFQYSLKSVQWFLWLALAVHIFASRPTFVRNWRASRLALR